MKISIHVPTGEKRCPRIGEWFMFADNQYLLSTYNYRAEEYPIFTRHEIDVPEGARALLPYFKIDNLRTTFSNSQAIILPRLKVKKWFIEIISSKGRILKLIEPYTDESIQDIMCDFPYAKVRRVSCIEVKR
jgi:hypothetical protein